MTLHEEIEDIIGEWLNKIGLRIDDKECEILDKQIMRAINERASNIDVGELIKSLMWDRRISISYGDISEYIEKNIIKTFK